MMTFEVLQVCKYTMYRFNLRHEYLECSSAISQNLKASTNLGGKYNLIPNLYN